jgi:hypothetical protein
MDLYAYDIEKDVDVRIFIHIFHSLFIKSLKAILSPAARVWFLNTIL